MLKNMNEDTSSVRVEFRGISKIFENLPIVNEVNLPIKAGDFVAFVGPSGCGKTTLLNMAAGLMDVTSGEVLYNGKKVTSANTGVGYLTQHDALLPWRDVVSNVALPLEIKGVAKSERLQKAASMLAKVGLSGFERHRPTQLSGGMRKRVNLARTLVYQPQTLLLDEPFGALDAQTRIQMHKLLLSLCEEFKLTVLLVTHDIAEAVTLADKVALFTARPARLVEVIGIDQPQDRDLFKITDSNDRYFRKIWDHLAFQMRLQNGENQDDLP